MLFTIVKVINNVKEKNEKMKGEYAKTYLDKNERKELKAAGVSIRDKAAVKAYFDEKAKKEAEALEAAKKAEEEKAAADRLANPTTEDLLKQIKALLEQSLSK